MVIAIASGKGGTGKTTIATNLAKAVSDEGVSLLDCDVEEPNSHLFMKPTSTRTFSHTIYVPKVDNELCTGCGKCAELCQFKAIINIKDSVLTFPELCHGCKGCQLICPENAISEGFRENGSISIGHAGNVQTVSGTLRIGEAMAVPLISRVLIEGFKQSASVTLIDAPPGTSCPVIESVKHADFVLLVTEPTPFGLHDLRLAVDMVRALSIPCGVVINRSTTGNRDVWGYCAEEDIPILLEIPDDREIAEAYSKGNMIIDIKPEYIKKFKSLYEQIRKRVE